jgi:hypothetical protein
LLGEGGEIEVQMSNLAQMFKIGQKIKKNECFEGSPQNVLDNISKLRNLSKDAKKPKNALFGEYLVEERNRP